MENVFLEISLCLIENIMIYVVLSSLLELRFSYKFPLILTVMINSAILFCCTDFNMFIKIPITIICLTVGAFVLFKDKLIVKVTYSLIPLYAIYIIDIILGNVFSFFSGKDIIELFYGEFIYRLISCLIIKAIDGLVFFVIFKMLNNTDKNTRNKFWILFLGIMIVFLSIATVFLQIYPTVDYNTANAIMYSALALLFFAMSLIVIYFFTELNKGYQRDSKLFLLENNFATLQEQIAVQQQNSENVKKIRHDMKNHLSNIRSLIDCGEITDAVKLLDNAAENVNITQAGEMVNTGNNFVDAIILSKTALCKDKGIDFTYSVQPLQGLNIDVVDLSSLLSNLLDNAVESAVQTSSPFIKLAILKYNAYYTICVENSYKGKAFLKESSGTLITTKSDRALHGYGTQIISDIAQMYDGSYSWEAQEYKFVSTVLLKI
ncbi:MAG TPA: hypothetical protein DCS04_03245 [Ruminococcaceae bacterium]|nr:hypothetical protein [Oscillospiraceae bacterium]